MCGLTGIWYAEKSKNVVPKVLEEMTRIIFHRGPDDEGYYIDGNLGLGFRRLSIIDLTTGHQPMCDIQEQVWIVFNGEIYNYVHLKNDLKTKGYIFRTNSDTEVILNAYLEYGEGFVTRLRGMFSIAIYDKRYNKIVLIRDRFGIKPLYYLLDSNKIIFSSELKSILVSKFSSKELDWQALDSYFSYGYILSPLTIYKDIRKLSPGHIMTIESNDLKLSANIRKYWEPTFNEDSSIGFEESKTLIREKLLESVKAHLVSDVPIGAFLSGGIDSNAVLSQMISLYPDKVKTFSIGFKDREYDETAFSKKSASYFSTDHTELILEPESVEIIDKIIDMFDEPFADSSAIPTYFVSKLASQYVKVVLSGDGGDEFFGGYDAYKRLLKIQKYKNFIKAGSKTFGLISNILPPTMKGKRFLYSLTKNPDLLYAYQVQVNEKEKESFFHPDILRMIKTKEAVEIKLDHIKNSHSKNYVSRMMELDLTTYMTDDILTKVDRASMINSLEVRVPIIDHEFFELASRIPANYKIKGSTGKYIFREAVKDYIPEYIYQKPKSGFTIPIFKWFKNDLYSYCNEILSDNSTDSIINPKYIHTLLNSKDLGSLSTRIWPILVFIQWYNKIHKKN